MAESHLLSLLWGVAASSISSPRLCPVLVHKRVHLPISQLSFLLGLWNTIDFLCQKPTGYICQESWIWKHSFSFHSLINYFYFLSPVLQTLEDPLSAPERQPLDSWSNGSLEDGGSGGVNILKLSQLWWFWSFTYYYPLVFIIQNAKLRKQYKRRKKWRQIRKMKRNSWLNGG